MIRQALFGMLPQSGGFSPGRRLTGLRACRNSRKVSRLQRSDFAGAGMWNSLSCARGGGVVRIAHGIVDFGTIMAQPVSARLRSCPTPGWLMRFSCFATTLLLLTGACHAPSPAANASPLPSADAGACADSGWSAPALLIPDTLRHQVYRPSLAVDGERVVLAGNYLPYQNDTTASITQPLFVHDTEYGRLDPPPGDFHFLSPRPAFDGEGRLHLVWAEPVDTMTMATPRDWFQAAAWAGSVWHAVYVPESGWTTPEELYSGRSIHWLIDGADLVASPSGDLHLSFVEDRMTPSRVVHMRLSGDSVRQSLFDISVGAYTSVTATADGRIYLAYDAPDRIIDDDDYVIYVVRSVDGGETWSEPQRIAGFGREATRNLQIRAGPDGTVHVAWIHNADPSRYRIGVATSHDAGLTWTLRDDVPVGGNFQAMKAAADACGDLHLIYQQSNEDDLWASIGYVGLGLDSVRPRARFLSRTIPEAALASDDGRLHVVWLDPITPDSAAITSYQVLRRTRRIDPRGRHA